MPGPSVSTASSYDAATLAANTRAFGTLPDGDRIALLDDQWALVQSQPRTAGELPRARRADGQRISTPARGEQITGALGTIEYDERGSAGARRVCRVCSLVRRTGRHPSRMGRPGGGDSGPADAAADRNRESRPVG